MRVNVILAAWLPMAAPFFAAAPFPLSCSAQPPRVFPKPSSLRPDGWPPPPPPHLASPGGGDPGDTGPGSGGWRRPGRARRAHPKRRERSERRQEEAKEARWQRERRQSPGDGSPPSDEIDDGPYDAAPPTAAGDGTPRADDPLAAAQLEDAIDSFLGGEYDRPFAEDAPAPHPGLGPGETVDLALRSLRALDDPEPSHGAAVFLRFCAPLSRGDRWGGGGGVGGAGGGDPTAGLDPWKEVLRGAVTPTMLARRVRASSIFSGLLDWERLDVTEGLSVPDAMTRERLGAGTTVAFVSAALYFGGGAEPSIVQFGLRRIGGVWLIDAAVMSKREWFVGERDE